MRCRNFGCGLSCGEVKLERAILTQSTVDEISIEANDEDVENYTTGAAYSVQNRGYA